MQLVDQKERNSQEELEPVLYAALVNSMCQNFWPMFIGSVSSAVAAVLTALKTGNVLLWPCAALIVGIGTVRAFQMRKYERRTQVLSFEQAKHWSRAMRSAPWSTPACWACGASSRFSATTTRSRT